MKSIWKRFISLYLISMMWDTGRRLNGCIWVIAIGWKHKGWTDSEIFHPLPKRHPVVMVQGSDEELIDSMTGFMFLMLWPAMMMLVGSMMLQFRLAQGLTMLMISCLAGWLVAIYIAPWIAYLNVKVGSKSYTKRKG